MLNFTYKNQTEILFGKGQVAAISQRIPTSARILMLYGGGSIKSNGVYQQVQQALSQHQVWEFGGVEPNPSYETLMQAVALGREQHIDFILAVGGGSAIDGAKFIAAALHFSGDPWDILIAKAKFTQVIPIGAVLTLPATGSESNGNSVVTKKATAQKRSFSSTLVQPQFAVLDPEFTYSLPKRQISNGIVDAFVHVMEQYLTYPVHAEIQDRFAESILQTLLDVGPKALKQPENYQHRANLMWAASMALNGLIGAGVPQDWSTHMIGHELTALYGLDHAQTLAIVLPALMFVQRHQKHAKLVQLGRRVFAIHDQNEDVVIDQTIKAVQDFFETVGVKTRLSDYQLDGQVVQNVVNNLERNGMTALGERNDIDLKKAAAILRLAL
ncbi:iron-containing alcohol dehydrogenase [Rheinheimera tilapiae]|uniref:Iron-containing alcohol dehydrogenase n=1 Tax=Rheinheimera tilapiae TaxID=875043 RepID=A0ABV6BCH4_9GAMM